jgi:hypothetical protein
MQLHWSQSRKLSVGSMRSLSKRPLRQSLRGMLPTRAKAYGLTSRYLLKNLILPRGPLQKTPPWQPQQAALFHLPLSQHPFRIRLSNILSRWKRRGGVSEAADKSGSWGETSINQQAGPFAVVLAPPCGTISASHLFPASVAVRPSSRPVARLRSCDACASAGDGRGRVRCQTTATRLGGACG